MPEPLVTSDEHVSNVQNGLTQWRTTSLKLLGQTLDAYDERSPEDFADIVDALLQHGFTQQVIAAEFKVSIATISRWAAGKTSPIPTARAVFVRRLRQMLNRHFIELQTDAKRRPTFYPVTTESP